MNIHIDCQEKVPKCEAKARLLRRQKSTSEIETRIPDATVEEESKSALFLILISPPKLYSPSAYPLTAIYRRNSHSSRNDVNFVMLRFRFWRVVLRDADYESTIVGEKRPLTESRGFADRFVFGFWFYFRLIETVWRLNYLLFLLFSFFYFFDVSCLSIY